MRVKKTIFSRFLNRNNCLGNVIGPDNHPLFGESLRKRKIRANDHPGGRDKTSINSATRIIGLVLGLMTAAFIFPFIVNYYLADETIKNTILITGCLTLTILFAFLIKFCRRNK